MNMPRFEELVARAVEALPDEFLVAMENVDVVVQDSPSRRQLAGVGRGMTLLGLYEGVPQTRRTESYGMVVPDRIVIFRQPILAMCRTEAEIEAEIGRVVRHEIAHHFGMDDDELRRIEGGEDDGGEPDEDEDEDEDDEDDEDADVEPGEPRR